MNQSLLQQVLQMPDLVLFFDKVNGELLAEKERRMEFYKAIEENKKMEFINGEIIFQSPVMLRHNRATGRLYKLLDTWAVKHGGIVGIEKILVSLTRNDYEPDLCYFSPEKAAHFKSDQMQFPAPDFVVEVLSKSTEAIDRSVKKMDYAAHGVQEYWIIDPESCFVEQYCLREGQYELFSKIREGFLRSLVLNEFSIDIDCIFRDT